MRISDWSSDVCSSDLAVDADERGVAAGLHRVGADLAVILFPYPAAAGDVGGAHQRLEVGGDIFRLGDVGQFGLLRGGRSEEHTSELQSLMRTSYAVFCLKKTKTKIHDIYSIRST